jgi:RNA polymerase sigma factor (sigma-70 family)
MTGLSNRACIDGRTAYVEEPPQTAAQAARRPPAPDGFGEFFRASFRELVKTAMIAGASLEDAEDAAAKTLAGMLSIWPVRGYPLAYARRAVVNNFIKDKIRGNHRVARRLVYRGHVPAQEGVEDAGLTAWEDDEWVADVLSVLPPAQQQVMQCIARGLDREEIAEELGKSKAAVRRSLCDARARLVELLNQAGEPIQPSRETARPSGEEVK